MINLLIVEDSHVVRMGLKSVFDKAIGISVSADAEDGQMALGLLRSGTACDAMLVDLNMPGMDGLELGKIVTEEFPRIKTILLTMQDRECFVKKAKQIGFAGYLLKDDSVDQLVDTIKLIMKGVKIYP